MDGTDEKTKPTAETEEATKANAAADTASGDAGAGETATEETAAQDTQTKADAAADETPAKADQAEAVTEKAEKPAEDNAKPTDDKSKDAEVSAEKMEELTAKVTKTEARLRESMAENAAYKAGIRPDRVDKAVLLAGISGIDLSADDAKEKFEAALQAVADDMPEFTAPPASTGSPGAFARKKEPVKDAFLRGLQDSK